jgi:hypothetical protein
VSDATPPAGFGRPDLTAFARLDGLGLSVTGQRLEPGSCGPRVRAWWNQISGADGAAAKALLVTP